MILYWCFVHILTPAGTLVGAWSVLIFMLHAYVPYPQQILPIITNHSVARITNREDNEIEWIPRVGDSKLMVDLAPESQGI